MKHLQLLDREVFESGHFYFDTEELKAEIELLKKQHENQMQMARIGTDEKREKLERALSARIERLTTLLESQSKKN